jgi:pyrimidine operon attenuation protein/uracil phosphoribosyltransferase
MSKTAKPLLNIRESRSAADLKAAIGQMVHYVGSLASASSNVALVGIQTRGAILAKRIAAELASTKNILLPVGEIDITLYRDDFGTAGIQPIVGETNLDFDVSGKHLILIDDVLFTGRTIRAALDELMDYGRPERVSLAVLVDRGHRELPIEPQFSAIKVTTQRAESVVLLLEETDDQDELIIGEPKKR